MAGQILTGTLKIDGTSFLNGLRNLLAQGALSVAAFTQKAVVRIAVSASTEPAVAELNKFQDSANRVAAGVDNAVSGITANVDTTQAGAALTDLEGRASKVGQAINEGLSPKDLGGGGLAGKLGLAGVAVGLGAIVKEGVGANAEMETFQTQIGTLLKGSADFKEKYKNVTDPIELQAKAAEEAKARLAELNAFGAATPFELPQIAKAEKVLLGFGLSGKKAMELTGKSASDLRTVIGDVAAGTGVAFDELAVTFGKFSTGATGESLSRLQELGIVTKEELKNVGIEFDKAGSLVSPVPEALTAAITIAQQKFGGGMEQLSKTFEGRLSTMADIAKQGAAAVTGPIFTILGASVEKLNAVLSGEAFQGALTSIGNAIAPLAQIVVNTLEQLITPLSALLTPLAANISNILGVVAPIVGKIVGFVGQVVTALSGPLGDVLTLVGSLVVALLTPLSEVADVLFPALLAVLQPLFAVLSSVALALVPLVEVVGQILLAVVPLIGVITPLAGVFQALAPSVIPLVQVIGQLAAILTSVLVPILNFIVPIISTVATFLADILGGAIGFVAGLIVDIVAGPFKLLAAGLDLLGIATESQTAKELKLAEAQQKSLETQRKANESAQQRQRSVVSLASEYEKLGSKANRSADEERRLGEVQKQLNGQYPGLITSTRGFSENLSAVKNAAQQSRTELGRLGAEMLKIEAQSREVAARMSVLKVNAAEEDLRSAIKSAASTLGIGGGDAADTFLRQFASKIRSAESEVALAKAFNDSILGLDQLATQEGFDANEKLKIADLISKLQDARQGVLNLRKAASAPVEPPPTSETTKKEPSGGGDKDGKGDAESKVKEINGIADAVKKAAAESSQLQAQLNAKAVDDEIARIAAEAKLKREGIEEDVKNRREAEKRKIDDAKADLKKGQKLVIEGYASEQEAKAAIDTTFDSLRQARLRQARTDEAKAIQDSLKKQADDETKVRLDLLKKQEEAILGEDSASAAQRATLRAQQVDISVQAQIDGITRSLPAFRTAVEALDAQFVAGDIDPQAYADKVRRALEQARPDLTAFIAGLTSTGKELLDSTITADQYRAKVADVVSAAIKAAGDNPQLQGIIQQLAAGAQKDTFATLKTERERRRKDEEAAIGAIANADERAMAQSVLDARRANEDRLEQLDTLEARTRELRQNGMLSEAEFNSQLTNIEQSRTEATLDLERQVYDARVGYLQKTNVAVAASFALRDALRDAFNAEDQAEAQKKFDERTGEIQKELQQQKEALATGRIDLRAYNAAQNKARQDSQKARQESGLKEVTLIQRLNKALSATFTQTTKFFQQQSETLIGNFAKTGDGFTAILGAAAGQMGVTVLQAVADGQNVAQAAATALIDTAIRTLQALAPVLSAQILGLSLATPDAVLTLGASALAKWTILTGIMQAAIAVAGTAAKSLISRAEGGVVPGGKQLIWVNDDAHERPEYVVQGRATQRHKPLLDHINSDGDPVQFLWPVLMAVVRQRLRLEMAEMLKQQQFMQELGRALSFNGIVPSELSEKELRIRNVVETFNPVPVLNYHDPVVQRLEQAIRPPTRFYVHGREVSAQEVHGGAQLMVVRNEPQGGIDPAILEDLLLELQSVRRNTGKTATETERLRKEKPKRQLPRVQ